MFSISLGPILVMEFLLGNPAVLDVHPYAQDAPSTGSLPGSHQELHAQKCPDQQSSLTTEAFSRMEPDGPFSVWDITRSITWTPDVQGLRRFIVHHSIRAQDSSKTHVLLQMELTHALANAARRMTRATLLMGRNDSWLRVWVAPDSSNEVLRLLLQGTVDLQRLQTAPHQLIMSGGEVGLERLVVFDNIMLR